MTIKVDSTSDSDEVVAQAMALKNPKPKEPVIPAGGDAGIEDPNKPQALGDDPNDDAEIDPDNDDGEDGEVDDQDKKPEKKTGSQRKKEALQRERTRAEAAEKRAQELESDREFWRREAQKTRDNPDKPKPEIKEPEQLKKPSRNDFDTAEKYEEAYETYIETKMEAKLERKQRETAIRAEVESLNRSHNERMDEFRDKHPDIDERLKATAGKFDIPAWINHALFKSEFGPQIMYELTGNLKELKKVEALAKTDPESVYRTIHRLEFKFEAERDAGKKPDGKDGKNKTEGTITTISGKENRETKRASEPITPVRPRGTAGAKSIYDQDLTPAEFRMLREEQKRQRRESGR